MTQPEAPEAHLPPRSDRTMEEYIPRLARSRPQLVRLAECLSLAAGVERPLLRRARLRFLPRSAAGLEAELWFSPLVEAASEHSLVLDPAAAAVLRRRLALRPRPFVQDVRDMLVEAHLGAQPVARWFEDLLWADLFPATSTPEYIEEQLRRVLHAVTAIGDSGDEVGRWALHYVPRLPSGVRRYDDAWRIQVASSERLGLAPPVDDFPRPPGVTAGARALVRRDIPVGVVARSDGLVLSCPPVDGVRTVSAPGVRTARIEVASVLAPRSAPVRLELEEHQSVRLPFTVVQRLSTNGEPTQGIAHLGNADEVAVASGVVGEGARYAVLLADGTIVLYADDGTERGRLPAEDGGPPRKSLSVLADGRFLAWIEGGTAITYEVASGRLDSHEREWDAALLVRFTSSHTVRLVQLGIGDGQLLLDRGRHMVSWAETTPVRTLWLSQDGECAAFIDGSGVLRVEGPWELEGAGAPDVTAVTSTADAVSVAWAHADGTVCARVIGDDQRLVDCGAAPWQITSLAMSDDGRWITAVGGDSRLLLWELVDGAAVPHVRRLAFCADRVFALPGGEWAVSGTGGPVELTTDDGRQYVVTPDTEALAHPVDVPGWIRGEVIAVVRAGRDPVTFVDLAEAMESIRAVGVTCLTVGPITPTGSGDVEGIPGEEIPGSLGDFGGFASLLMSAHHHGVRIVVDMDLRAVYAVGRILNSMRQWLDHDVDGLRLVGDRRLDADVLRDVRHLLDGYDDRVLIGTHTTGLPATADSDFGATGAFVACDVVVRALQGELIIGLTEGALVRNALVNAQLPLGAARSGAQWGHLLPDDLTAPGRTALALRVLLGLPGCPIVPLSLLQNQDPEVSRMLELRRDHLALSRGDCRELPLSRPGLHGVVRRHGDEIVLCVANAGANREAIHVTPDDLGAPGDARLLDLFGGTVTPCSDDTPATVTVDAGAVRWYRLLPIPHTSGPGE
ncbi:alpha-amylase family protein [Streptomyces melanogenes]|uniref:alpha-amylase family protein n=1 Tax=Streptomyces melanogenes TaxID=67326 RepID=UPI00167ECAE9|nr:alpha-amylase family protein [Streptomyces melanogenes]GGP32026.1 hypothetical protein GCM10010278_02030 [Streptomyces melanogenes]